MISIGTARSDKSPRSATAPRGLDWTAKAASGYHSRSCSSHFFGRSCRSRAGSRRGQQLSLQLFLVFSPGSLFRSQTCASDGWQILVRGICPLINTFNGINSTLALCTARYSSHTLVRFALPAMARSSCLPVMTSDKEHWHNINRGMASSGLN